MPYRPLLHFPLAVLLAVASCSNQGEGERCDKNSNDRDCASGLVCVSSKDLLDSFQGDRCCPATVTASTDARCRLRATTPNVSGSAGTGAGGGGGEATGGEAGAGSPGAGGAAAGAGTGGEAQAGAGGEAQAGTAGTDTGGAGP
jgi:hypothetical protein